MNNSTENTLAIVKARKKVIWCVITFLFAIGNSILNPIIGLIVIVPYVLQPIYTYSLVKAMNYKLPFLYSVGAIVPFLNVLLPAFLAERARAKLGISALL